MRQKIVFFHLLNNFTGSPQILSSVIHTAKQAGHPVKLYTSRTEGFLSDIESETNFYKRSEQRIFTLFSFFFSQFVLAVKLLIESSKEEKIYYVNTILPFGAILVGRLLGKRVVTHVHEYEISPKPLSDFLFWVVRNFSSEVVVVSRFLESNPKLIGAKTRLIYNCVTSEFESKAKVMSGSSKPGCFNVLMLASLRPYKGIGDFVELACKVPDADFTLVLSDDKKEVDQYSASEVLPLNLTIFPVQKNVHSFYAQASLILNLAHPDEWVETFGMTVLEGMYYGLPAIVPTKGGITELVELGINGFQIDYTELDRIAGEVSQMKSRPEYWGKLSRGAELKRVDFSREIFEFRINELLQK